MLATDTICSSSVIGMARKGGIVVMMVSGKDDEFYYGRLICAVYQRLCLLSCLKRQTSFDGQERGCCNDGKGEEGSGFYSWIGNDFGGCGYHF